MMKKRTKKTKGPNERQKAAFDLYYALGNKRSHIKVAKLMGVLPSLITNWSIKFGWVADVEKKETGETNEITKLVKEEQFKTRADYRKLIGETLKIFEKTLKDKKIKVKTIPDLEKLAKLDLLMEGEPTEVEEIKITFTDVEADDRSSSKKD